ncbi:uncharacterized protein RCC_03890 [Ramularia collo-cygni]|uniref:Uncharacterized protein n=1 Tax=Ramularia collo-cygni TaxID=112498 RepID=A0A2D3UP07_9PEZI|nr:uncharacterized protein RCC_03890 [Ramularia collo-cygni]CZT18052.1 uncharacterized protein RCC_03890 [Ramularia collo-cygni]
MSQFFSPRNVAIGVGLGGLLFAVPRVMEGKKIETFGSQNIAERYSAGGGTKTHLPGVATPRAGDPDNESSRKMNGHTGIGTKAFKENHEDQKVGDPGAIGKAWHQSQYGSDKGK